jgi:hypothetical protein
VVRGPWLPFFCRVSFLALLENQALAWWQREQVYAHLNLSSMRAKDLAYLVESSFIKKIPSDAMPEMVLFFFLALLRHRLKLRRVSSETLVPSCLHIECSQDQKTKNSTNDETRQRVF